MMVKIDLAPCYSMVSLALGKFTGSSFLSIQQQYCLCGDWSWFQNILFLGSYQYLHLPSLSCFLLRRRRFPIFCQHETWSKWCGLLSVPQTVPYSFEGDIQRKHEPMSVRTLTLEIDLRTVRSNKDIVSPTEWQMSNQNMRYSAANLSRRETSNLHLLLKRPTIFLRSAPDEVKQIQADPCQSSSASYLPSALLA